VISSTLLCYDSN